ncbi:hypothetical protein WN943_016216 [Citrus x changshan-huyou]
MAKCFAQKEGIDYNEVFSSVVKRTSIRILLALVAEYELELAQLDVKAAFLHGDLEEKIYMISLIVAKLLKMRIIRLLDGDFIYLLLYVDDMLIASKNRDENERLKKQLASEFEMKDLSDAQRILGIEIRKDKKNGSDRDYMARVPYASTVGSLMYVMLAVKWILRYLYGTIDVGLLFKKGCGQQCMGYCDSDFAGDLDKRRSTTGYVFTLGGGSISWRSILQSTIALSTTEAEYMAATEAVKEAIWLKVGSDLAKSSPIWRIVEKKKSILSFVHEVPIGIRQVSQSYSISNRRSRREERDAAKLILISGWTRPNLPPKVFCPEVESTYRVEPN